jgi:RNA polymerase sigma-70 factor (ECF subfamily)
MIFWLYYEQGMTAKAIAALPSINLTSKGVESAISRLTRLVREQVVQLRTEKNVEADQGEKGFRPATSF